MKRRGFLSLFVSVPLVLKSEIKLKPDSPFKIVKVKVRPRKLKANWTVETQQALKALHGIEAENLIEKYLEDKKYEK